MAARAVNIPRQAIQLAPQVTRRLAQQNREPLPSYTESQSQTLNEIMAIINDPRNQLPSPPTYDDYKKIHDIASQPDNARFFNSALVLLKGAWKRLTFPAIWQIITKVGKTIAVSGTLALSAYMFYNLGVSWVSDGLKYMRLDTLGRKCLGCFGSGYTYLATIVGLGFQPSRALR